MSSDLQKNGLNLYYILPKCVSNELLHLIRPDKSSPPSAHGNRLLNFRSNLVRQLTDTFKSRKCTGRKRNLPIGPAFPNLFLTVQKVSGREKLCPLCIEKKKKQLRPERANRKHINVSSVTFRCAVWSVCLDYNEQRNVEVQN